MSFCLLVEVMYWNFVVVINMVKYKGESGDLFIFIFFGMGFDVNCMVFFLGF